MGMRSIISRRNRISADGNRDAWRPIREAAADGTVCDLRFRDALGVYEVSGCFLHDDGRWYLVEPPTQLVVKPIAWRPSAGDATKPA